MRRDRRRTKRIRDIVPFIHPDAEVDAGSDSLSAEKRRVDALENPILLQHNGITYTVPELQSHIISYLLQSARSSYPDATFDRAVVAVPAYFDSRQKQLTEEIVRIGFDDPSLKVRLINEPEAAALAAAVTSPPMTPGVDDVALVFDLGGGTFDCSIVESTVRSDGKVGTMECVATSGDAWLGGADFDHMLAKEVTGGRVGVAEVLRIGLTGRKELRLRLPDTDEGWDALGPNPSLADLLAPPEETENVTIYTRAMFEKLVSPLILRLLRPLREVALLADVALLGDASPATAKSILDLESPLQEEVLDEVEALKLAQKGARKRSRDHKTQMKEFKQAKARAGPSDAKVLDMSGSRRVTRVVLVGGATKMPFVSRLVEGLAGTRPAYGVRAEDAVALGAACQVGVYDGVFGDDENEEGGVAVMSPFQAALLRAIAKKEVLGGGRSE